MTIPPLSFAAKKRLGIAVGSDLVRTHGKQRFYSTKQVRASVDRTGYAIDWSCWAYSLYTSPADFAAHHNAIGEVCDYGAMRSEMTAAVTDGASALWFDVDLSWLDWPDTDFGSIFDFDFFD